MAAIPAIDLIENPQKYDIPPVCVLVGEETFLRFHAFQAIRNLVLTDRGSEFSLTRIDTSLAPTFPQVIAEVSTLIMFGEGRRLVTLDPADQFVSQNKDKLEVYVDNPSSSGVLVLQVSSFPSNLRLYKKLDKVGMIVDCKPLPTKSIPKWLVAWAARAYNIKLASETAALLVELVGDSLGALDQELAKLNILANGRAIDRQLIEANVRNTRQRKAWDLVDLALDGNTSAALRLLRQLYAEGENPVGLLAQITTSLRRIASAVEYINESPMPPTVNSALARVGVPSFVLGKTAAQLNKLGPRRARTLIQTIVQTDVDLKGGSKADPKEVLERFIVKISAPQLR
ncbi:MAG: DNA polymerase III subunit delta [Planctomycetia bacterium]|nr:DNA polymerase III subunit delta [Planctomycetia bacterium]